MSTPSEIAARTRRTMIGLIALVVVLVVALIVTIVIATRSGSDTPAADPTSSASSSPSTPIGPDGALRLPTAGDQLDGRWPVNFDRSPEGAVAMAAAYITHDISLDPQVKAQTRLTYFSEGLGVSREGLDASMPDQIESELRAAFDTDTDLEALPRQASLSGLPVAAVYEPIDADTVDVALLINLEFYDGISRRGTQTTTWRVRAVWDESIRGGDWVMSPDWAQIEIPEIVEPGTDDFADSEWIPLGGDGS
ncbi:hypothetical protein [Marinactinospora rubrisoli]|uniref:Integral membrane protein n=1 Tax=Marinactinospora rubrisoli TaxID=2715399 RepID=A0ABW2KN36_9ACTN